MASITPIEAATPRPGLQRDISRLIRMLMARDGLNQEQLGKRIGMDQTTVSARLRGSRRWSVEDLGLLAEVFQVHPGVFWTDPKDVAPSLSGADARPGPLSTGWLTALEPLAPAA